MISHKSANVVHFLAYYSLAELNQASMLCNSNSCDTVSNAEDKSELSKNYQSGKEQSWRIGGITTEVVAAMVAGTEDALSSLSLSHSLTGALKLCVVSPISTGQL